MFFPLTALLQIYDFFFFSRCLVSIFFCSSTLVLSDWIPLYLLLSSLPFWHLYDWSKGLNSVVSSFVRRFQETIERTLWRLLSCVKWEKYFKIVLLAISKRKKIKVNFCHYLGTLGNFCATFKFCILSGMDGYHYIGEVLFWSFCC